MNEKGNPA